MSVIGWAMLVSFWGRRGNIVKCSSLTRSSHGIGRWASHWHLVSSVLGSYSSETRLRYWNGYMLFYERLEGAITPVGLAGKAPVAGANRVTLLKQDSEGEIHV